MDLTLEPRYSAFREEVRSWIADNLPADMAERGLRRFHFRQEDRQSWTRMLAAKGWSASTWPVSEGGPGWDALQVMIFEEECLAAGAPELEEAGFRLACPVIYTFGTEEQKRRFLEPTRAGEMFWGQGFSERGAGSDLAALSTRAVRDGNEYVINGHKLWTSNAQYADQLFLLAKTDPAAKQRGISFLIVDARAKGVTIRPIIDIGEGHGVNEVFLDDVRTPVENLIGEENKGWSYAKFLLDNERAFSAEIPRNKAYLSRLKRIAHEMPSGAGRLIDDPSFAMRIAEVEADLAALEFLTLRALAQKEGGTELPVGSLLKVGGSELMQKIGALQIEALGDYGGIAYSPDPEGLSLPGPPSAAGALADFFYRRAVTIYGGANEIQRSIIARSFLGL